MKKSNFSQILEVLETSGLPNAVVNLSGYEIPSIQFATLKRVIEDQLAGTDVGYFEIEVIAAALGKIDFIQRLNLKGCSMNKGQTCAMLGAVETAAYEKFVVDVWGYPIQKSDASRIRQMLLKDTERKDTDSCDMFKIAAMIGEVHGKRQGEIHHWRLQHGGRDHRNTMEIFEDQSEISSEVDPL